MLTLQDILETGNKAAEEGTPWVPNWPQARSGLKLFDRAKPLDEIELSNFDNLFPDDFNEVPLAIRKQLISRRVYKIAQREIRRVLATQGYSNDPWEALKALIVSETGQTIRPQLLNGLKSAARSAGYAPSEITSKWVWSYDYMLGTGAKRITFRRSIVTFNQLFKYSRIAASGLLPTTSLGSPPIYDRRGNIKHSVPPLLKPVKEDVQSLEALWQIICLDGKIDLPRNPTPDDLMNAWPKVKQINAEHYGLKQSSFTLYLQQVFRHLKLHASPINDINRMPFWLEDIFENSTRYQKAGLRVLWRKILSFEDEYQNLTSPGDLLEVPIWRKIWREAPLQLSIATEQQYEALARHSLLAQDSTLSDPKSQVGLAWRPFSRLPIEKSIFQAIFRAASWEFIRPREVCVDWLTHVTAGLLGEHDVRKIEKLLKTSPPEKPEKPKPSEVEQQWTKLREIARNKGINTSRWGNIANPAIAKNKVPSELTRDWVIDLASNKPTAQRINLNAVIKGFDYLHNFSEIKPHLPEKPLGVLPSLRKNAREKLPETLETALRLIFEETLWSKNTRQNRRSTLITVYTAAYRQGLVNSHVTFAQVMATLPKLGLTGRTLSDANCLKKFVEM